MALDYKAYPHIFQHIINHTTLRDYISLQRLNSEFKQSVSEDLYTFRYFGFAVNKRGPTGTQYAVQITTGSGYHIGTCFPQLFDQGRVIDESICRKLQLLGRYAIKSYLAKAVELIVVGDCDRDHFILQALTQLLPWSGYKNLAISVLPDAEGAVTKRLVCNNSELSIVKNWRSRPVIISSPNAMSVTFQIDGSERGRLVSAILDKTPAYVQLDFEYWQLSNTVENLTVPEKADLLGSLVDLASNTLALGKNFAIIQVPPDVFAWLGIPVIGHGPQLPWNGISQLITSRLRGRGIQFLGERVFWGADDAKYELSWTVHVSDPYSPSETDWSKITVDILRFMNLVSDLNTCSGSLEVYRQFRVDDTKCLLTRGSLDCEIEDWSAYATSSSD